jgi:hypothetical protein
MLAKRSDRAFLLLSVLGAAAGVLLSPQLWPREFSHSTEIGFIAGNSSGDTTRDVIRHSQLSESTWEEAKERCIEGTATTESLVGTPYEPYVAGTSFTDRVICTTPADLRANLLSYAIAALIVPLLLLLGRIAVGWVSRGEKGTANV